MKKRILLLFFIGLLCAQLPAQCWQSVTAGDSHTLAIKTDGSLWAWGSNIDGQLGDGTNSEKDIPVQIGSATNWQSITAGYSHTLAIKTDGSLWAWGSNIDGQLGDGTNTDKNSPVQIGSATNWQRVTAGYYHTLAIKTDGTLWACGLNYHGQLGDGTNIDKNTLVQIGSVTNWQSVTAGFFHSFTAKTDGSPWAFGSNINGQLGDGTNSDKNTPTLMTCPTSPVGTIELGHAGIRLFPNPTTNIVRFENVEAERAEVFDQLGRLVRRFERPADHIDISTAPEGIYFLKILEKGKTFTVRVLKE